MRACAHAAPIAAGHYYWRAWLGIGLGIGLGLGFGVRVRARHYALGLGLGSLSLNLTLTATTSAPRHAWGVARCGAVVVRVSVRYRIRV